LDRADEARSEAPECHRREEAKRQGRTIRQTVRRLGIEMLHRFGAERSRSWTAAEARDERELGNTAEKAAVQGLLLRDKEPDVAAENAAFRLLARSDEDAVSAAPLAEGADALLVKQGAA
jgi:hypothetical protein